MAGVAIVPIGLFDKQLYSSKIDKNMTTVIAR
jgi:hypothetical protein